MTLQELDALYVKVAEIATDYGVSRQTVHNWLRYHGKMPFEMAFNHPVVLRSVYEEYKTKNPPSIKEATASH